jgi:hypothetical protein
LLLLEKPVRWAAKRRRPTTGHFFCGVAMGDVGDADHFQGWMESGGMERAADVEAGQMAQSRMQSAKDKQALVVASTVEQMLDKQLDDMGGEDELERLRAKRIEGMREAQRRREEGRRNGHGSLRDVADQKQFFSEVKESEFCVAHFYRSTTRFCAIVDMHMAKLAPAHLETKFLRIDAEKSQYLVEQLQVVVMPTVLMIKDAKVIDRIEGFNQLGGTEHFSTATFEQRLRLSKVISNVVFEQEDADDDFDPE